MNPSPTPGWQFDPFGVFAGAAGTAFVALLIWVGLSFLGILGMYWLIRLAVRHGTMDTARWQAAGMPSRGSRQPQPSAVHVPPEQTQLAHQPRRREADKGVPVPPRDTLQW